MKIAPLLAAASVSLLFSGCASRSHDDASRLGSERDYAAQQEAIAQDLFKTGQVASLEEGRAQAAATVNRQWATAAKTEEKKQRQESFEKELARAERAPR